MMSYGGVNTPGLTSKAWICQIRDSSLMKVEEGGRSSDDSPSFQLMSRCLCPSIIGGKNDRSSTTNNWVLNFCHRN
jgi:hypothetical protein